MDRDINRRVNNSRVIKFEIKDCDSNLDVFSSSGTTQQFNCIDDEWLSQGGTSLEIVLVEEIRNFLLLDWFFRFWRWWL
jgi:hypothetical protein